MRFVPSGIWLTCAVLAAVTVAGAATPTPKVLTWVYSCQPGGSFGAEFVVGTPKAKLWLPGQPGIELTQMMSGSGARYGGQTYELFIKGRDAYLEKGGTKFAENCQAVSASGVQAGSAALTEGDSGKALQLKVGQTVHFKLSVQTGTGYTWEAPARNTELAVEFGKQSAEPRPGARAELPVSAKANQTGFLVLEFQYARPWEKGTPPAKTARFPILIIE